MFVAEIVCISCWPSSQWSCIPNDFLGIVLNNFVLHHIVCSRQIYNSCTDFYLLYQQMKILNAHKISNFSKSLWLKNGHYSMNSLKSIIIIVTFFLLHHFRQYFSLHQNICCISRWPKCLTISFMNIDLAIEEENSTGWKSMISKCNIDSRTAK